ncbi:hypothetical protein [Streptacidiphilus jiangxiensis]|uniref:Uncharacterized protein n=1 Tax=Streptacidiphilus jiangxiensis TaxID=235985 RepID=A0A1H7QIY2_STRJI|nr:hypothetical protein [Streptacidiphilus jiangxiensis]SEL47729.1 hypothetical protein SAMN05414137_10940 [Streptacidiphilus jiangxiensis]
MRRTDLTFSLADALAGRRALCLEPTGPHRPQLRVEMGEGGRLLVRQGGRPLLLGRLAPGNQGVHLGRLPGYRPVLPPLRATTVRRQPDWTHWCADRLAESADGPLHVDRWLLREGSPPEYAWHGRGGDLVTDWPYSYLDWGDGWNGIVPLRPLSAPDDGRVAAYRRQIREGAVAPILLWWITGLDGWLLLDGHDRLVAAREEGVRRPAALILSRGLDAARQSELLACVDEFHTARRAELAAHGDVAQRAAERAHADTVIGVMTESAPTTAWPLAGGPTAFDALAARCAPELVG